MIADRSAWTPRFLARVLVGLGFLIAVLALGVWGIRRSLWLDEIWVANSIRAGSLHELFHYREWLQTSPPLFLLLSRIAVRFMGLSNAAFRAIPLGFALLATGLLLRLTLKLLPAGWAALASSMIVFHPAFLEYSHSAKQYSGEVLATVMVLLSAICYLREPGPRQFAILAVAVPISMTMSYPVVFLLPGVLLVLGDRRRTVTLAGIASATLLILWYFFIRGNTGPELRAFWLASADKLYSPGLIGAVVFAGFQAVWGWWTGCREKLLVALPIVLLAVANAAHLYPGEQRMRLWALPCFVILATTAARDLLPSSRFRSLAAIAAVVVGIGSIRIQFREHRDQPLENYAGAIQFLSEHAGASDLVLIHAAAREGFHLYADMDGWKGPAPRFGSTGWACCARGKNAFPGASSEQAVVDDLNRLMPDGFRGRVWLLYPTRPTHWRYTGLDEGNLWRKKVWEKGCPPENYLDFQNLSVSSLFCGPRPQNGLTSASMTQRP